VFSFFSRRQESYKARLQGCDIAFDVGRKDNLLNAALEAGIQWPHSCRVGSCTTCRCILVSGKIKELNDFSYVLDKEQLDKGMILACQTQLRSDIVVDVELDSSVVSLACPDSSHGVINGYKQLTHDILEICVELEQCLPAYLAGQYAEVSVPGIEKPRNYSFAKALELEEPNHVTFHIRHVPGGEMTGWFHDASRIGERIQISGPFGQFYLRESNSAILCIAGGSGMAPIKALLEGYAESSDDLGREIYYLFGARTQEDLYCLDDMDLIKQKLDNNFTFIPVLSNEPEDSSWTGRRGFVTDHLTTLDVDLSSVEAYLCGPPPMIDAAIDVLTKNGVSSNSIHFDKFLDASHLPGGKR